MEESLIRIRIRRVWRGAAVTVLALLGVSPAPAQTAPLPRGAEKAPEALKPFIGAWDIEKLGASRECTVTFGAPIQLMEGESKADFLCRAREAVMEQRPDPEQVGREEGDD